MSIAFFLTPLILCVNNPLIGDLVDALALQNGIIRFLLNREIEIFS